MRPFWNAEQNSRKLLALRNIVYPPGVGPRWAVRGVLGPPGSEITDVTHAIDGEVNLTRSIRRIHVVRATDSRRNTVHETMNRRSESETAGASSLGQAIYCAVMAISSEILVLLGGHLVDLVSAHRGCMFCQYRPFV
jgi:hypothetical protein